MGMALLAKSYADAEKMNGKPIFRKHGEKNILERPKKLFLFF